MTVTFVHTELAHAFMLVREKMSLLCLKGKGKFGPVHAIISCG